ncbi:hypothetical protein ACIQAC_16845 [Streptomyces sp. NPDC088387]|uniref:hypothetical protein n=1 Tax=Streptomyces sp. NPDC088387 TaxID=3365859 RepID=UPI00382F696F
MTGSTPPWKRRFPRRGADTGPTDGPRRVRDDERGPFEEGASDPEAAPAGTASLEPAACRTDLPAPLEGPAPAARRRAAVIRDRARDLAKEGARKGGNRARTSLALLADRIIDLAPRVPVRDLATLRRHFPGLGPDQIADKLIAGAANASATVGAGIGAAAMMPVPPAMPTELAAEVTGVAAIELKLIAELHEVYGLRPPGNLKERSTAYLRSWAGERGIDVLKPASVNSALGGQLKRELRQQIMKRMVRNMPNLMPFMVGAAVGAVMNRRDTKKLAARVRGDLRRMQVPWDALSELPVLEQPARPLPLGDDPKQLGP